MIELITDVTGTDVAEERMSTVVKEAQDTFEDRYASKYPALGEMLGSADEKEQWEAACTVLMMKNQEMFLEQAKKSWGESTVVQKLGDIAPALVDVIRVAWPNSIASLIADVQPLERRTGDVLVIKPTFGQSAAGVNSGDEVFAQQTDGSYASTKFTAAVGTGDGSTASFTKDTGYKPIKAGTITIYLDGVEAATDDGNGSFTGTNVDSGNSTADYAAGIITIAWTTGNEPGNNVAITASFNVDIEAAEDNYLREIDLGITVIPVTAEEHPLRLRWSEQARFVAMSSVGVDVDSTLAKVAGTFLKIERDRNTINLIRNAAGAYNSALQFDALVPSGITQRQHFADFTISLAKGKNIIFSSAGRGAISFIICGTDVETVATNTPGFVRATNVTPIGAHVVGYYDGTIPVIADPGLPSDEYIIGFNGALVGDAGIIICDWIPVYFTPTLTTSDLKSSRALLSMYGVVVNNANYYVRGKIINF